MRNPIVKRPWLLVILAFLVVIGVWITVIRISNGLETRRLTPEQEARILQSGGLRHD